jgi:two-component system response regulator LytT
MRVLIIEDEARIAKRLARMTKAYFEQQLSITVCDTLAKGLAYIEQSPVDVLLLDLNLNGENGFAVLEGTGSAFLPYHHRFGLYR